MSAKSLNGKALADNFILKLKEKVATYIKQGKRAPTLAVILVGNHAASMTYVANKVKACDKVGIKTQCHRFNSEIAEAELLAHIECLNQDTNIDGILVQLPLPAHINPYSVLTAIHPLKDVDGFHPLNMGHLALKIPKLEPATPKGIIMLLKHYVGDLTGLNAVVVGASNIVGRPMMLALLNERATVTICHSKTRHLSCITQEAELLIVAVGIAGFITQEFVKPGAIVVDVGINYLEGKLTGDVDFVEVAKIAAWLSPVPGGVGPMTIIGLLDNTLKIYEEKMQ